MHMYMYICICIYAFVFAFVYVFMYIYTCMCKYITCSVCHILKRIGLVKSSFLSLKSSCCYRIGQGPNSSYLSWGDFIFFFIEGGNDKK